MESYSFSKVRAAINLAKKTGVTVQTALWVVDPDPERQEANLARLQAAGLDVGPAPGSSPQLRNLDLPMGPASDDEPAPIPIPPKTIDIA